MKYILLLLLSFIIISCKENKHSSSEVESKLKTTHTSSFNELSPAQEPQKTHTVSEFNTDDTEIENIQRPQKTIFRNLAVDTTQVFGIWTQDPNGQHADFMLTKASFFVVDYDGNGDMPYVLDRNEISIFYNDFIQKGIITSTENETLTIMWSDSDKATTYVKFEN